MDKFKFYEISQKVKNIIKNRETSELSSSEIADYLKKIKKEDKKSFYEYLKKLPNELLGEVILELPESLKEDAIKHLDAKKLTDAVEELESDDATDLIKDIEEVDENLEKKVYENLSEEHKEDINKLSIYEENQAGAYMQLEVFEANLDEKIEDAINRLRKLKKKGELENIQQVYVVDNDRHLKAIIPLGDLIIYDFNKKFKDIAYDERYKPITVRAREDIKDVIKKFEDYDLPVIAVVDDQGKLLGRITSDDIIDLIEEQATEQIYNLAGVQEEAEEEDDIKIVTKKRAWWLFINLWTAILASVVIGLFDETIQKYVALAVLMPIVASMGGNAGTQTLTVVVRKLALGEISWENAKEALFKESAIALINGMIFAVIMGVIAWIWFNDHMLGFVIALAMVINLLVAGFFGAVIPLVLKKIGADPAVGSSVVLTTVTDVVGFFAFLGLAKLILVS
ncbi:magnesium transporter [Nitrosophilus kaiyonis]|uniref:magnesium transporter n=1 Tax=Nitrosophilus kaiyonis TaxID=2930200 RepID=UPI00248FE0B5|nr:magnesium transporter [Nitrosophilus kaiyonis]